MCLEGAVSPRSSHCKGNSWCLRVEKEPVSVWAKRSAGKVSISKIAGESMDFSSRSIPARDDGGDALAPELDEAAVVDVPRLVGIGGFPGVG